MAKKRVYGEGGIYQRSDGRWCAQIRLPSGRRKTKYGKTQREVRDWVLEQQSSLRRGMWSDNDTITVGEFLERYLCEVVAHTVRPKTEEVYGFLIKVHLLPEIGRIKLTSLQPHHLQSLYAAKLTGGYARKTVRHLHFLIHKALGQAVKWGLVARNVAAAVEAPRLERKPPHLLTETQARSFLESVKPHPLYPLYVLAITTGMRKGELLGLRWVDIDLNLGIIQVSQVAHTLYQKGTLLAEPKTQKARRAIELPPLAVEVLREHRAKQERLRAKSLDGQDLGLAFPSRRGTPIGSRNLLRHFYRTLDTAGLPKVSFHSLRHLHSTLLLMAGIHPKIVQERLGHSRIDTTLEIYSHVMPGMQRPAAEEMNKFLQ